MDIYLSTENCIVTGKKANVFTGHVVATGPGGAKVTILAGFVDHATAEACKFEGGCAGEWLEKYGVTNRN